MVKNLPMNAGDIGSIPRSGKSLGGGNEGFPGGSVVKNPPANAGDTGLIPGWGRCPGRGNSNPLQYSCQENSMDRFTWWAAVHGVTELDTTEGLLLSLSKNSTIAKYMFKTFSEFLLSIDSKVFLSI